ncbi:Chorismate synthase [Geodia barretti]|uniref:Chorismate synthase n=1 Tax=Geodia barretti TaxID=519541 RepID=A0AA35S2G8_GEOBA|nr:Chorismate synthase [Geodia barretti]
MGEAGAALRVIAGAAGAALSTYAPPEGLPAVAAGQLNAKDIRSRHRRWGRRLHALVPVYGVVGSPIGQSLSPPMHEAAFRRLGIEAAYLPFAVPLRELADFLVAARLSGVGGLNLTIPLKRAALPLLDELDDDARRIGAVNTIIPMNGGFGGANTDWIGAVRSLEEVVPLAGRRATVLGAGGSARAVLYGLTRAGAEPVVISRNDRKAAALADEMGVRHAPWASLDRAQGDILVNTTPVGMAPDREGCPAPDAAIAAHEVVFDLVFHPEETRLLRQAAGLGKRTVPGLRMLILQAAAAFERWIGRPAPIEAFRVTTWGESHGPAIGVVVDGCPPRLPLSEADIQQELDRRRPGQSALTSPRREADRVAIQSGVIAGQTTGHPIAMVVQNRDARPADYEALKTVYRPSHADYTFEAKYGIRDKSGGGRSSARVTVGHVAAGAVARVFLAERFGVECVAYVKRTQDVEAAVDPERVTRAEVERTPVRCPDPEAAVRMVELIDRIRRARDSVGGVVECAVRGVPAGLGEPVFDKLESDLAKAMLAINASKGFEIGSGFAGTRLRGSEHNDRFVMKDGRMATETNNAGGVLGGISTGMPIVFRVAFKPTSTIGLPQQTVDSEGKEPVVEPR